MMRFTVERIVEDIAVLEKEDMTHIEVSLSELPDGIKEGNVLVSDCTSFKTDEKSETEARERIVNKQRSIFKKR